MPRCVASLKMIAIVKTVQMSLNAIESTILPDREAMNWKEWARICKRKCRYSCGDEDRGDSPKKSREEPGSSLDNERCNKRKRNSEDEVEYNQRKRPRLQSEEYNETCSKVQQNTVKDDICVMYSPSRHPFCVLKKYFYTMPSNVWNEYTKKLLDEAVRRSHYHEEESIYFRSLLDYTLCGKLTRCSTDNIDICLSHSEEFVYRKLRCCGRLEYLHMTVIPLDRGIAAAMVTLQRLQNLVILTLLPPVRYSFHWAIQVVGKHMRKLRELKIVYNGDVFNEGEGITDLQQCRQIVSLWLFNLGRQSETKHVCCLLSALTDLKVLFHKELPNAILEMSKDSQSAIQKNDEYPNEYSNSRDECEPIAKAKQLGLERIDLCWYERGTGYQLVYVPSSYLFRVAQMCPNIKSLNLIGPPCLSDIVHRLPLLRIVTLRQANLVSCLGKTLREMDVSALTVLRVSDVWDVTHDLISSVALKCPALQVLSVTSSTLEARGALIFPSRRPPFPCLCEVTLVPSALKGRPSLTSPPVWQLGAALTRYVMEGALHVTSVHLHYKDGDIPLDDMPSEQDLEIALCCPRPNLCSLTLEWPPVASPTLVERLVEGSPALTTLAGITTWPLSPRQCADVIATYSHRIDIT